MLATIPDVPDAAGAAAKAVNDLWAKWRDNARHMAYLDRWHRNQLTENDLPKLPSTSTAEHRSLRRLSLTPWAQIPVNMLIESLFVEGFRDDQGENLAVWSMWQQNRLDDRQTAFHEGAAALGMSYANVAEATDPLSGVMFPKVRGLSARNTLALYDDPASDEFPALALQAVPQSGGEFRWRLWTDSAEFSGVTAESGASFPSRGVRVVEHGLGVCPVVRFAHRMDLEGRVTGEVEPYIGMISRLNQTTFDRLMVQRFAAWVVRWATGLDKPSPRQKANGEMETEAEAMSRMMTHLEVGGLLVSTGDKTKFGTLPATDMRPYSEAITQEGRVFASNAQLPPHALLGETVNLSTEALEAAKSGHNSKVQLAQHAYGESWETVFRLGARIVGDEAGAASTSGEVRWRDTNTRSFAAVVDGIAKLAQVGVPMEVLLDFIPGWTDQDVRRAVNLSGADDFARLFAELDAAGVA